MSNPNDELKKALDRLEEFTQEQSTKSSRLEEVKSLLQGLFFSKYKKEKDTKQKSNHKELLKSVGVIKSYLPLIDKYRHGTPEEKKFAEVISKTITNYNEALLVSTHSPESINLVIENSPRFAYQRGQTPKKDLMDALFSSKSPPKKPPSKEETDTLKMKAIRLIESEGFFKDSLIESIKNKELGDFQEIQTDDKTVTLMQTWSELPGEIHRIVGDFKRESKHSIPIKDSFKLYLESIQPGHPYPSQRMGWSLSHWLIPSSVLWLNQIPLLQPLIERKNKAAKALLPSGEFNQRARKLFRFKKNIFDSSRLEYLSYQQALAHSIVKASAYGEDKTFHKIINTYFENLAKIPAPFEAFSKASEEMNKIFIEAPFEKAEEVRLSGQFNNLFAVYDLERDYWDHQYSEKIVPNDPYEIARKDYILYMGRLIGDAAALLLKLQLSEKFKAKPPPLSDFELKLQAVAFKHLVEFLDELEADTDLENPEEKERFKQRMRIEIGSEVELFSSPTFDDIHSPYESLTEETISYFHARYHAHDGDPVPSPED